MVQASNSNLDAALAMAASDSVIAATRKFLDESKKL